MSRRHGVTIMTQDWTRVYPHGTLSSTREDAALSRVFYWEGGQRCDYQKFGFELIAQASLCVECRRNRAGRQGCRPLAPSLCPRTLSLIVYRKSHKTNKQRVNQRAHHQITNNNVPVDQPRRACLSQRRDLEGPATTCDVRIRDEPETNQRRTNHWRPTGRHSPAGRVRREALRLMGWRTGM